MKKFLLFIIWGTVIFSAVDMSAAENTTHKMEHGISLSQLKKRAYSKEWLKLVHYKQTITGKYLSQVDDARFFLHANGKKDPQAELRATLEYFLSNTDDLPVCKFPARLKYINKVFGLNIKETYCPEITDYLGKLKIENIAVVFSSYYINNPASIFGHSFMKINSDKADLLEYGINFAVDIGTDGSLKYIYKGLTGGYFGKYSLVSYFDKVREYNDFENRDIWIYYLDMSDDEHDTLVKHLWELLHAGYAYFFLSENCSYHILSAIEAAKPDCDLTGSTKLIVIPADTLKVLMEQKGLVKRIEYRPSLQNIFFRQYSQLTAHEKNEFHDFINSSDINAVDLNSLNDRVLTALIDYYNYKYPSFHLSQNTSVHDKKIFTFKKSLLVKKSEKNTHVHVAEKEKPGYHPFKPHEIHGSSRLSLFGSCDMRQEKCYIVPEFRWLYHDLNDSIRGYPVNTEMEGLKFSGKFLVGDDSDYRFYFQEICFLKLTSLNDFSFYQKRPSFLIYAGAVRTIDERSENQNGIFAPTFSTGLGLSKLFAETYFVEAFPSVIIYGMITINFSYSKLYSDRALSFGYGPRAGMKLCITDSMTLTCQYDYLDFVQVSHDSKVSVIGRVQVYKNCSFDVSYSQSLKSEEIKLGLMYYY